jgi:hypothetical protein
MSHLPPSPLQVRRSLLKPPPSSSTVKHHTPPSFIDLDFPPIAESIGADPAPAPPLGTVAAGAPPSGIPGAVEAGAVPPHVPGIESACTWRRPIEFLDAIGQVRIQNRREEISQIQKLGL